MAFEKNVFINCPFDNEYFPLLRSILFALIYLEFNPRISETTDSGQNRLESIKNLIKESKFSIHDISRVQLNDQGLPRFNMPFECGIDFGAKLTGSPPLNTKTFLILASEQYKYQQYMSDIAGNDIRSHQNDPEIAIKHVRDWLKLNTGLTLVFPKEIWLTYTEFLVDYLVFAEDNQFNADDLNAITFSDLIELISEWIVGWKERKST